MRPEPWESLRLWEADDILKVTEPGDRTVIARLAGHVTATAIRRTG